MTRKQSTPTSSPKPKRMPKDGLGFATPDHVPAPAGGGPAFKREEMKTGYRVLWTQGGKRS